MFCDKDFDMKMNSNVNFFKYSGYILKELAKYSQDKQ